MQTEPKKRSNSLVYPVIYLIVGVIVGGFIAVQIVTTRSIARSTDPVRPALELGGTLDAMKAEQTELKSEIANLREDVGTKEEEIKTRRSASQELNTKLEDLEKVVGLTTVTGEGVEIILDDGEYQGLKDRNDFKNDAIIHSTDILDVVNILWAAGAEAVAINEERVVNTTSINCIVNTILINESHVGTPLKIMAIGDKEELASFVSDPGRLTDLHNRARDYGLTLSVTESDQINVSAFSGTYEI
ncbi:DUF881 domain-containing protein [Patescibacteria group bacterium]